MATIDPWVPFSGAEAVGLAIVLLIAASGFAFAGSRLRTPLRVARPGWVVAAFMLVIWVLTIYAVNVVWLVYGLRLKEAYPDFVAPTLHRAGTFSFDVPVSFLVILFLTRRWGWKTALASAAIGTAAAPMIFEFPFDLIVMMRSNPPIPVHPMLYEQLLYLPLFLAEVSTLSLLTLLPSPRVTAYTAYAVAGMLAVFAVWAAFGFGFPAAPLPLALNVIAKMLSFAAAITLFVWSEEAAASDSPGGGR
jgi:hypothetical protein